MIEKNKETPPKDSSIYVHQKTKTKHHFELKNKIEWTDKQKTFIDLALDKNVKVLLVKGPAGSSKTLTSVFCALKLLQQKKISDIIYIRPAVESSDSKLGFLPGDLEDKMHFYNLPFFDKLDELLNKQDIEFLSKEERLTSFTVNFARGMSWNGKAVILDETQNFTQKEIITLLTRIGHFCKVFVLADPMQSDLTNGKVGAFDKIYDLFNDEISKSEGIHTFEFTNDDIVRSELTKFLVHKFQYLYNINKTS